MRRIALASALVLLAGAPAAPVDAFQDRSAARGLHATCDPAGIDPDSYRLTTEAQALNVLRPREPWWEPYGVWKGPREIGTVNAGALRLAERARELDDRNLLAHGYLARQRVVEAVDAGQAEEAWTRVLDDGGAIVWTATLPEVDARAFFALAFDRQGIRIFRFAQLAGPLTVRFGFQEFPREDRVDFWRALGGCLPAGVAPEAELPWSAVREVRTTRRTLRFELSDRITIASDRGRRRTDATLDVLLHGQNDVDARFVMTRFGPRAYGPPPTDAGAYLLRVQQMLTKVFGVRSRITE
jgi:hypothetical protein